MLNHEKEIKFLEESQIILHGKFKREDWIILLGHREVPPIQIRSVRAGIGSMDGSIDGIDFKIMEADECFTIIPKNTYNVICRQMKSSLISGIDRLRTTVEL